MKKNCSNKFSKYFAVSQFVFSFFGVKRVALSSDNFRCYSLISRLNWVVVWSRYCKKRWNRRTEFPICRMRLDVFPRNVGIYSTIYDAFEGLMDFIGNISFHARNTLEGEVNTQYFYRKYNFILIFSNFEYKLGQNSVSGPPNGRSYFKKAEILLLKGH